MGVGNLPAARVSLRFGSGRGTLTLGQPRSQKSRDLLDERVRRNESVVLARELLDQLLVLVQLLQVIRRHCIHSMVLGSIDVVLVPEDAVRARVSLDLTTVEPERDRGSIWRWTSTYQTLMPGLGT